jgi:hypothetical protein
MGHEYNKNVFPVHTLAILHAMLVGAGSVCQKLVSTTTSLSKAEQKVIKKDTTAGVISHSHKNV